MDSKIILFGETVFDLTGDTVTAEDLAAGKTAHDKSGAAITGTNTLIRTTRSQSHKGITTAAARLRLTQQKRRSLSPATSNPAWSCSA